MECCLAQQQKSRKISHQTSSHPKPIEHSKADTDQSSNDIIYIYNILYIIYICIYVNIYIYIIGPKTALPQCCVCDALPALAGLKTLAPKAFCT
jgi:hypothetical protein